MKKTLFTVIIGFIPVLFLVSHISAQEKNYDWASAQSNKSNFIELPANNNENAALANAYELRVSPKAVKNFMKSFRGAENTNWYKMPQGLMVYFTVDGIKMRSVYDNKGNWLYSLRFYTEEYLPKNMRHQVKSNYYDFNITAVNEVQENNKTVYFIQLEGTKSYKTIWLCDGEMEVANEFIK
jgi:hypothetical protein